MRVAFARLVIDWANRNHRLSPRAISAPASLTFLVFSHQIKRLLQPAGLRSSFDPHRRFSITPLCQRGGRRWSCRTAPLSVYAALPRSPTLSFGRLGSVQAPAPMSLLAPAAFWAPAPSLGMVPALHRVIDVRAWFDAEAALRGGRQAWPGGGVQMANSQRRRLSGFLISRPKPRKAASTEC